MSVANTIPSEILEQYGIRDDAEVTAITEGHVNATFRVVDESTTAIYQRLAPLFTVEQTADYASTAEFLQSEGWEIPNLIPNTAGGITTIDHSGKVWRGFEYIESDNDEPVNTHQSVVDPMKYGIILARLHQSLAKFDYEPQYAVPHFHDTAYHASVLEGTLSFLPDQEAKDVAAGLLDAYHDLAALPDTGKQLIHGDPRVGNMLHRDGEPFTFIDWDTMMKGTIWMDMGDILRSIAQEAVAKGNPLPIAELARIAEGYREIAFADTEPRQFRENALLATQKIALELGMRYAADFDDEDPYFSYDPLKFDNRKQFIAYKSNAQLALYRQLEAAKQQQEADLC